MQFNILQSTFFLVYFTDYKTSDNHQFQFQLSFINQTKFIHILNNMRRQRIFAFFGLKLEAVAQSSVVGTSKLCSVFGGVDPWLTYDRT